MGIGGIMKDWEKQLINSAIEHMSPKGYSVISRMSTMTSQLSRRCAQRDIPQEAKLKKVMDFWNFSNENPVCPFCLETPKKMGWDHIEGFRKKNRTNPNGGHRYSNMVPMCNTCNSSKGSKTVENFIANSPLIKADRENLLAKVKEHQSLFTTETAKQSAIWDDEEETVLKMELINIMFKSMEGDCDDIRNNTHENKNLQTLRNMIQMAKDLQD